MFNSLTSLVCGTLSNAFEKSNSTISIWLHSFIDDARSSMVSTSWATVDKPRLNPCCRGNRIIVVSYKSQEWFNNNVLHKFATGTRQGYGSKFDGTVLSTHLCMGIIFPIFHFVGTEKEICWELNKGICLSILHIFSYMCYRYCPNHNISWYRDLAEHSCFSYN